VLELLAGDAARIEERAPGTPSPTSISCVVIDGEVVIPTNWKTLEKLPTKQELTQRLASTLNTPAMKLVQYSLNELFIDWQHSKQ
jgi:ribosomal protein L10